MKNKLSFGQKVRLVRDHYGINLTTMSDKLGIVKSNLSRYERDLNKPTIGFIELLLKHYRVNLNWLFGEREEMLLEDKKRSNVGVLSKKFGAQKEKNIDVYPEDFTSFGVPIYSLNVDSAINDKYSLSISGAISAGEPLPISYQDNTAFVPFPMMKSNNDIDNYIVFKVNGLSMAPEIYHEDIVFIQKNNNWHELNNKIVAVMIQGDMTLKKLHIDNVKKEIIFKALNKDYDDINISFEMMESTYLLGELRAIRRIYLK